LGGAGAIVERYLRRIRFGSNRLWGADAPGSNFGTSNDTYVGATANLTFP
jgi:hypothetical protein